MCVPLIYCSDCYTETILSKRNTKEDSGPRGRKAYTHMYGSCRAGQQQQQQQTPNATEKRKTVSASAAATGERSVERSDRRKFDRLIDDRFRVGAKIGSGSYGQIRLGTNVRTGQLVAIKFEPTTAADAQLRGEYQCYQALAGRKGFPAVHYFGRYGEYECLVMDRLGRNLETLYDDCGRRFSLKSMIFIALQLVKRFETIHNARIVYRDVKPENFMLGSATNTIFVIDFGLSTTIGSDGTSAPMTTNELIGTSRYMSISAHLCRAQSRRDDLESLGYMFAYFLRGRLPWSGLRAANFREHNQLIVEKKRTTSIDELCEVREGPLAGRTAEFAHYLKYVRSLEFDSIPNYEKLRNMFKRRFHLEKFTDDGVFDWNQKPGSAPQQTTTPIT